MSGKIEIHCGILETAVEQMKTSYTEFDTLTQNGFKTEIETIDGMNSDFIEKLARVLEISQDWSLKKLNTNLTHYIQTAQIIYEEIKKNR